jgi:hypothetical protein
MDLKDVRGIVVDSTGTTDSIVDTDFVIVSYPLVSTNFVASGGLLEVVGSRLVIANEGLVVARGSVDLKPLEANRVDKGKDMVVNSVSGVVVANERLAVA